MPYTKSTQKKYGDNPMKKRTGFKMKGFSGFKQKEEKQVPLSAYERKMGVEITGGSKAEIINDLEDRIEFLQSDLAEGKGDVAQLKILKAKLAKMKKQ